MQHRSFGRSTADLCTTRSMWEQPGSWQPDRQTWQAAGCCQLQCMISSSSELLLILPMGRRPGWRHHTPLLRSWQPCSEGKTCLLTSKHSGKSRCIYTREHALVSAGSQMPCGSAELHYLTELKHDQNNMTFTASTGQTASHPMSTSCHLNCCSSHHLQHQSTCHCWHSDSTLQHVELDVSDSDATMSQT